MTGREQKIFNALNGVFKGDKITITDYAGDQEHFTVEVCSAKFDGLSRPDRQRLVYQALGSLAQEIHAFQFKLTTP